MTAEPIIEVRDLVRCFVTRRPLFGPPTVVRAVDGVSFDVRRGETFAIVGESGCGKSTLARLLIRLLDPDSGSIVYRGRNLADLGDAEMRRLRRELQFVFQDPFSSLNPRMTVGALVEEPMRTHGVGSAAERRARVHELLGRVGLRAEHANRYPHEFSGGQRQRIGIARALASGPQVIIADEPVSALDVSVQAQVVNLLEDLKEEFGLTLIVIAHDLAVIRHMSDTVAVMYLGKIAEMAPTDALYDQPLHPYTQALMAAIPVPEPGVRQRARPLKGDIPSPTNPPPGCRFHTRCPHAEAVCSGVEPPLEAAGEERRVACHLYREIQGNAAGLPQAAPRPAAAETRFALYRAYREKQEGARLHNHPPDDRNPSDREETSLA